MTTSIPTQNDITVEAWLKKNISTLRNAGIPSARLDCMVILENVLHKTRTWLIAHEDYLIENSHLNKLETSITQRANRTPLAYIIGSKEFYGRSFIVSREVLIPRPESETIIDILKIICGNNNINTVIDIGTGSGVLAITAKLELPSLHVAASDISKSALSVAKKNAKKLQADVRFHYSDLFENLPGMPSTRSYAVIVNLPYVPSGLVTSPEITKEPSLALFSKDDGLDHYRRFWQQISTCKNKPTYVLTESLENQHLSMVELASASGYKLKSTEDLIQLFVPTI